MRWRESRSIPIVYPAPCPPATSAISERQPQLIVFEIQKPAFIGQSAAVPGQFSVAADDSVAGNDDGDGVRTVCQPDCTRSGWVSETARQFSIRGGLAERNVRRAFHTRF